MKIQEVLEKREIQEGPLDTIGTAIGKTVGGTAKAVGAVAGGVAGIGQQLKKGYQAGKRTVGGVAKQADRTAKSAIKGWNAGKSGTATTDKTPQEPFEIIKSLNKQQKQKLYNML